MTTDNDKSLFSHDDQIFANKELLEINHLPEDDHIVGRDDEIQSLAISLNPALFGQSPSNVLLYGKTGTGKSLCAKHVSRQLVHEADNEGVTVGRAYVDAAQDTTETQAVQSIATALNTDTTDISIPDKGISTSTYYKRLWHILDAEYYVVLVILDEIDKLEDDDILMQLSRAGEAGKLDHCKLGIIGISNKINYGDQMDERVKSSLGEREFVFPAYDALQLREIMQARVDAFKDGVLEEDVIPRAAAEAAKEHGDARKAIDILRYAGEIAQTNGDSKVREEYVVQAHDRAEINRFQELIRGAAPQSKRVLRALAGLTLQESEDAFRTSRVYDAYEEICRQHQVEPLSARRVRDLLQEHAFLDVIEQADRSGGSADGKYTEHRLLEDPEVVRDVLAEK
jgi:cell division control protein 6